MVSGSRFAGLWFCERLSLCSRGQGRAPPPALRLASCGWAGGPAAPAGAPPAPCSAGTRVRPAPGSPRACAACDRRAAFHMCSQGLPIGVLRRRGRSLKSAPVPMTDDIFMQENKTRISDGLRYLSRQFGATAAK